MRGGFHRLVDRKEGKTSNKTVQLGPQFDCCPNWTEMERNTNIKKFSCKV